MGVTFDNISVKAFLKIAPLFNSLISIVYQFIKHSIVGHLFSLSSFLLGPKFYRF